MTTEILTTEECGECHHVFTRYVDYDPQDFSFGERKSQQICPVCRKPVCIVKVRHPGESL